MGYDVRLFNFNNEGTIFGFYVATLFIIRME